MYKEDYEYNNKPEDKCEEKYEVKVKEGTTKCYDKEYEVCGKKEAIVNKHYHNNHFTRFNDIMVTDCHFVKNYVEDCNRVHHKVETIDLGTKYLGCSTIEEKKCEWKEPKCHEPKCHEPKCEECKKECKNECKKESKKYIDVSEWEKKDEDCGHSYWCDCKEEKNEKDYDCWC
ncbi:MAG: hypothetical protein KH116_03560 [Clostridium sp.]|nr:hypothetical protein [Clostridium sp.]